jgi:hypothetical protein
MRNKLTALLIGGILVVASGTAAAGGNVSFGISIGVPAVYAAPVYAPPPVVYYPAAPVYYGPPVVYYNPRPYYAPAAVFRYNNGRGHGHRHHVRHR